MTHFVISGIFLIGGGLALGVIVGTLIRRAVDIKRGLGARDPQKFEERIIIAGLIAVLLLGLGTILRGPLGG